MAKYKVLGEGLYGLETPYGNAVLRTDEDTLRAGGHEPMTLDAPVAMEDPGALSEGATADYPKPRAVWGDQSKPIDRPPPPPMKVYAAPVDKPPLSPADLRRQDREAPLPAEPPPEPAPAPTDKGPLVPVTGPQQPSQAAPAARAEDDMDKAAAWEIENAKRGGGGYSPGGMRLSSRTVKGKQLPPGTAQALADEAARPDPAQPAMEKVGYTQVLGNEAQADALRDWSEEEEMKLEEDRFKRAAIDREITRKSNEAQRAWQDTGKVPKLDSERHWKSKTTLGKVLASVLLGLGWIIAAKTGVNPAQVAFNKANEDDMEAQKSEWERAQAAGKVADNAYARDLDRWGKPELAEQAFRLRGEKIFDAMVKERALRTQNPEIMARIELWGAEREDARQRQWGQLLSQMAPSVEETYKYQAPSGGGVRKNPYLAAYRAGGEVAENQIKMNKARGGVDDSPGAQRQREYEHATRVRVPDGKGGVVLGYATKGDKSAIDNMVSKTAAIRSDIRRFKAANAALAAGKISQLDWVAEVQSIGGNVASTWRQGTGAGSFDNGFERLANSTTGLPTKGFSVKTVGGANLDRVRKFMERQVDSFESGLRTLEQEQIRQSVTLDPAGTTPLYGQVPEE